MTNSCKICTYAISSLIENLLNTHAKDPKCIVHKIQDTSKGFFYKTNRKENKKQTKKKQRGRRALYNAFLVPPFVVMFNNFMFHLFFLKPMCTCLEFNICISAKFQTWSRISIIFLLFLRQIFHFILYRNCH